ncbi:MAG TPA: YibE/F family protein [Acidimicrobiales bacterium]|nr:YibE/F family protein [Acidimicrobiales bacterium]
MHAHLHGTAPPPPTTAAKVLVAVTVVVGVLTAVGLVALWPRGEAPDTGADLSGLSWVDATVTAVDRGQCPTFEMMVPSPCDIVSVDVTSGPTAGERAVLFVADIDFAVPDLAVGDGVILQYNPLAPPEFRYTFFEFQRTTPLVALALLFAVVVIALGRWRGVRALLGLGVTGMVLLVFLLPSLLRANPPILVALTAAALIAMAALYLAHGVTLDTTVALVGALAALTITTGLAALFVALTQLSGLAGADAQLLRVSAEALDPAGVLIAGIVIGALGVLDDVTVTQVATVAELRAVGPRLSNAELYRRALRVGRDHIASTVNTLVLAYAGASLALLVFFVQSEQPLGRTIGREIVATEIVRALVGGIGLVAAVPISTGLAVLVRPPVPDAATAAGPSDPDRPGTDRPDPDRPDPDRGHDHDETGAHRPPSWDDFAPDDP